MINPKRVLDKSSALISERGANYGGIEDNFNRIAAVASAMLGKQLSAYDIAIVLTAVKLARMPANPVYSDNYVDAINYIAFAHELKGATNEDEMALAVAAFDDAMACSTKFRKRGRDE